MLTAISRYGARVIPNTEQIIARCRARAELIQGPQIAEFEETFARRVGAPSPGVSASYGRMAFAYGLKALGLPPGSEIIFPALTFWVVPEIARVSGFQPRFADINPNTFTLDPAAFERAITERTRAVVPTHLFGLSCDMDAIVAIADKHKLAVIEDCAHALGSTYHGRPVGTFGDVAFFSFQTLKPLNTYGGGIGIARDQDVRHRMAALAAAEPWPDEQRVNKRLLLGKVQRVFIRPRVFTVSAFPILWTASWFQARPDVYLWESIRPLTPLPDSYTERYTNVQAAIGLEGLAHLDRWTQQTRAHAELMNRTFRDLPGVQVPAVPPECEHVYYQYCLYAPDRDDLVRRALRRGIDVETLHVDVCTQLELFGDARMTAPGAERAAQVVQLPVYSTLEPHEAERVARNVGGILRRSARHAARMSQESR